MMLVACNSLTENINSNTSHDYKTIYIFKLFYVPNTVVIDMHVLCTLQFTNVDIDEPKSYWS